MQGNFGFLIERRNGTAELLADGADRPKAALYLPPGCMSSVEDIGFSAGLFEFKVLQQFDAYYGGSAGAIGVMHSAAPLQGFGTYSSLINGSFVRVSKADRMRQMQIIARAILTMRSIEKVYHYSGIKALASVTGADKIIQIAPLLNTPHLIKVMREDFPPLLVDDGKQRVIHTTNLETGMPAFFNLTGGLEDNLSKVTASLFLPYLSGQKPPKLMGPDGKLATYGDACFTEYPFEQMVNDGCTHIVVPLNRDPDEISKHADSLKSLIALYNYLNPAPTPELHVERDTNYERQAANMPLLLESLKSGEITFNGKKAFVRIIAPDADEPQTDPLTDNPKMLEDAFFRGLARGRRFIHQIEAESKTAAARAFEARMRATLRLTTNTAEPQPQVA